MSQPSTLHYDEIAYGITAITETARRVANKPWLNLWLAESEREEREALQKERLAIEHEKALHLCPVHHISHYPGQCPLSVRVQTTGLATG
jgi:hypothetical protein